MRDLDPAARRVLALAAAARTPSEADKARVARRLAVAVGASAALATASSAAHAANGLAASKWAVGLTATKAFVAVGALLAAALTGYALLSSSQSSRPSAPLTAAAPAPGGAAVAKQSRALGDTSDAPGRSTGANLPGEENRAARALPSVVPSPVVAIEPSGARPAADDVEHLGAMHAPGTSRAAGSGARTTTAPGLRHVAAHSARPDAAAIVQTMPSRAATGRVHAGQSARAADSVAHTTIVHGAADPARGDHAASSADDAEPASARSDTLGAELDLLHRAQVAWRSRDAASALALLNQHRARYPRSTLQLERDALQVLTFCELGQQAEASRLAHSVLSRAPNSPLRASLEESCALK